MRASHPNDLTGKILVFWEVVASKSWLHMNVGRYLDKFVRGDKTVLAATLIFSNLPVRPQGTVSLALSSSAL